MKLKWIIASGALGLLAVLMVCLSSARGGDAASSTPFIALSSVSVPEMPAKAASLVHAAAAADRAQVAEVVLRAVSVIARPGVLPYVVNAICRANPETAGSVVTTAIELQPEKVLVFSKAALGGAPDQVEQIVFSACKAAPGSCADVALAAFRQLPSAGNLVLAGFVRARPDLKLYLDEARIEVGTNNVEAALARTVQLLTDDTRTWAQ
jgi:hypothetical protein